MIKNHLYFFSLIVPFGIKVLLFLSLSFSLYLFVNREKTCNSFQIIRFIDIWKKKRMPFAIKDVLQHKRNDRQIREIHEREYLKYLTNLRQQQQQTYPTDQYYLSANHLNEIERSHSRNAIVKQHHYARIQRENYLLYDRLLKANKRAIVDDKNDVYQQNLDIFKTKRVQQRYNEYKRIHNDNQIFLQRLGNVRGNLISKQQCDDDWKKHLIVMKKSCDYPENIDKFVSKMSKKQQTQACLYSALRSARWNDRYNVPEPRTRLTITPLAILLKAS